MGFSLQSIKNIKHKTFRLPCMYLKTLTAYVLVMENKQTIFR